MILEFLAWVATPAGRLARRMGYVGEQVSIAARRARNRRAWAPHLDTSKAAIRRAIAATPDGARRKALVLGSGHWLDLPVADLAAAFGEVVLADMAHPWGARLRALAHRNVRLVAHDATEATAALEAALAQQGASWPDIAPRAFLDDTDIGLVVSLNLASQLPYVPLDYLKKRGAGDAAAREAFARRLIERHVDYLRAFRGTVLLISDVERIARDATGRETGRTDALHGAALPEGGEEWTWEICPLGEIAPDRAVANRVRATIWRGGME